MQTPPPSNVYDYEYGEPKDKLCTETAPGVFTRAWTNAMVHFDCNTMQANITLAGETIVADQAEGCPLFRVAAQCSVMLVSQTMHVCTQSGLVTRSSASHQAGRTETPQMASFFFWQGQNRVLKSS